MAEDLVIKSALEFVIKIREEDIVTVRFTKKDKTSRVMKCTVNFDRIPKEKQPKDFKLTAMLKLIQNHTQVRVYDLDKKDWRSIPYNRTHWLETSDGKRYKVTR